MTETVELLSNPTNYAIVRLPGRKFPGVVIQGDSLHSLIGRLDALHARIGSASQNELAEGLSELRDILVEASTHYENVCRKKDIKLPY